jgi:hypothetical protein
MLKDMIKPKITSRASLAILLTAILAGCQSTPNNSGTVQATGPSVPSNFDRCDRLLTNNTFTKKNAVPYHKCIIARNDEMHIYQGDLDKLDDYKRLELAEKYASGRISGTEFNSQMAEFDVQLNNQRLVRANSARMAAAQEQQAESVELARRQAAAASFGAALQRAESQMQQNSYNQQLLNQNQQIINNMNRPVVTNCNRFGSTTNCTSY